MKFTSPHRQRKAFTLIELMIVIVVLAILALIAVPSFIHDIQASQVRVAATELNSLNYDAMTIAVSEGETAPTLADYQVAASEMTTASATHRVGFILTSASSPWQIVTSGPSTAVYTVSLATSSTQAATAMASANGDCVMGTVTSTQRTVWTYSYPLGTNCTGSVAAAGPSQPAPSYESPTTTTTSTTSTTTTTTSTTTTTQPPSPPTITTSSLQSATQNEAGYSQTLAATGGTAPLTWSLVGGSLPSGLTLNTSTGTISGTVSGSAMAGNYAITVQVTDANGESATKSLPLTVYAAPIVTTSSLPAATAHTSYSATLTASGGEAPLTWSLIGSLPSGLALNTSTGTISGTERGNPGNYAITVQVTDANGGSSTKTLSLTVNS